MISPDVARYLDAFQKQDRGRDAPAWLNELRRSAIASFSELGFPTVKQEAWKYTNVQPIIAQPFVWDDGESRRISEAELRAQLFFQDTAPRLVFVNGSYVAEFSTLEGLPEGVRLGNLSHWVASDGAGLDSYLGRSADFRRSGFVALNTAFARDGAVVQIPSGCRVRQPIQLVYLSRGAERPVISHPRTLIILGAESETSMVESYAALDGGAYLCNPVTEIFAADGARARHYRIQKEGSAGSHVGTVAARLGLSSSSLPIASASS